jgi:hypothetical protein
MFYATIKKEKAFEFLKQLILSAAVLFLLIFTVLWAYAAFTESASAPSASNQDFTENILGANNANNSFNSSSVAANKNGSIIEMMEYINNRMTTQGQWYSGECADSTTGTKTNCYVDDTAKYVHNTACSAVSNNGYCFVSTSTLSLLDLDLVAANIKNSINIFGINGTLTVPTQVECCSKSVWSGSGCVTDYCTLGTDCSAVGYTDWEYHVYAGGSTYPQYIYCNVIHDGATYANACMCRLKS